MTALRIVAFGAGSIGVYVGGRLLAAGADVRFIGRARVGTALARHGLHLTDLHGADLAVAADRIRFDEDAAAARGADLVLVTVKSAATADAGQALAPLLASGARVLSLQNGLHNADELRAVLPQARVVTGMVPFNVVQRGQGRFHQGSDGRLAVEADALPKEVIDLFAAAGLPVQQHADMRAVLWAKLLLNLNNAINALSGVPLKQELSQRAFRRCLALAQSEALALLAAADMPLAKLTPLPPRWLPTMLSVPDALFRLLAGRMMAIDPLARSSMWEDFEAGRPTEIDYINGEVLRLATRIGRTAPVNARLVELVRAAEDGGRRDWRGRELLQHLLLRQGAIAPRK